MQIATLLTDDGIAYRDLNKNGRLDPYEDPRRPIDERIEDLLAQLTLAEKAGLMFQTFAAFVFDDGASLLAGDIAESPAGQLVSEKLMNHFNFPGILEPTNAAEWQNRMQALAEHTRLGVPITFATDPRHAFSNNPATSVRVGKFSQ